MTGTASITTRIASLLVTAIASLPLTALLLVPAEASAQELAVCGDLPELPDGVAAYVQAFVDPDLQWLRDANGIRTLPSGVAAARVTDERECRPLWVQLRERVRDVLPNSPLGREERRNGFRFLVYRVGPYYVVPVNPLDEEGEIAGGYEIVNVFLVATLEFVGDYLG